MIGRVSSDFAPRTIGGRLIALDFVRIVDSSLAVEVHLARFVPFGLPEGNVSFEIRHDSAACGIYGSHGDAEGMGDIRDRDTFQMRSREGLPGRVLKLLSCASGGPSKYFAAVFEEELGFHFGRGIGELTEQVEEYGSSGSLLTRSNSGEEIHHEIPRRHEEPTSKSALVGIGIPAFDGPHDGQQGFLGQILGIGILKSFLSQESLDNRFIDFDELPPGSVVR